MFKRSLADNRFVDAGFKLVLLVALAHTALFFLYFLLDGSLIHFNFFHIVGLDQLNPGLVRHPLSHVVSFGIWVGLYLLVLRFLTPRN